MNAYNPLESMKRLEQAGIARQHAEAIATEINVSAGDLVTRDYFSEKLDAAFAKQTVRQGALTAGIVAVATSILGLLISIQ